MATAIVSRGHTSAAVSAHNPACPDSPTGQHVSQAARLVCLCCRCKLPVAPGADIDITRLYRAFVSPSEFRDQERTVFVEAFSRETAIRKIAAVVSALEYGATDESVRERVYNCTSAVELAEEGVSEDHALRLYETGWCASEVISWVDQPLFLVREPAALIRAWARIPAAGGEKP